MATEILDRLRKLPPSQWSTRPPASAEALKAIEDKYGFRLPPDYRELLLATNGCGVYEKRSKVNLESADDVIWNNDGDPRFEEYLPGMFVIGDDSSGGVFYYDPENRLGKGAWALFLVDLGNIGFPYSKYVGATLTGLLEKVLADESLWDYRMLGPLSHPDRAE